MSDIDYVPASPSAVWSDIWIQNGDFAGERDLDTAIVLSLETDAPATPDELIEFHASPTFPINRGWEGGDFDHVFGSKLWLLSRSPRNDNTLKTAEKYSVSSLQWLVTDRVCDSVTVVASWDDLNRLQLLVQLVREKGDDVIKQYTHVWDSVAAGIG